MTVGQTAVVVLSPSCNSDAEADDDVDKTNEENDDNHWKDSSLSTVTMMMTMTLNKRSLVDFVDL